MVDWATHYDVIYAKIGVDAVITLANTAGEQHDMRVIDKTSGIVVEGKGSGVATIRPGCCVRTHQLSELGIERGDLRLSEIEFNGRTWRVESFEDRPSPSGLDIGELMLVLSEDA